MSEHTGGGSHGPASLGFDRSTETYHAEHEWAGTDTIGATVVRSVAAVTGADPMEMAALYDIVDPDALDQLFRPPGTAFRNDGGRVELVYAGCDVAVHRDGRLVIRPPAADPIRP